MRSTFAVACTLAGYGLDEEAIEAVMRYRFKPALKAGFEPVPVILSIEINFRLY
jgi:periplasmic protein TonB